MNYSSLILQRTIVHLNYASKNTDTKKGIKSSINKRLQAIRAGSRTAKNEPCHSSI